MWYSLNCHCTWQLCDPSPGRSEHWSAAPSNQPIKPGKRACSTSSLAIMYQWSSRLSSLGDLDLGQLLCLTNQPTKPADKPERAHVMGTREAPLLPSCRPSSSGSSGPWRAARPNQPTNQPSQETRERVVLYFLSCHCAWRSCGPSSPGRSGPWPAAPPNQPANQPTNQPNQQTDQKRKCVAVLPPLLPSCLTVMRAFFSREIWSLASCSTMSSSLRRCSCSWDSSFCHRLPCTDATSWNSLQACPENQKINRFIIFIKKNLIYCMPCSWNSEIYEKHTMYPFFHMWLWLHKCMRTETHTHTHTNSAMYYERLENLNQGKKFPETLRWSRARGPVNHKLSFTGPLWLSLVLKNKSTTNERHRWGLFSEPTLFTVLSWHVWCVWLHHFSLV